MFIGYLVCLSALYELADLPQVPEIFLLSITCLELFSFSLNLFSLYFLKVRQIQDGAGCPGR